jgi:hypothetical protein
VVQSASACRVVIFNLEWNGEHIYSSSSTRS